MAEAPDSSASEIGVLQGRIREFVRERDWEKFHNPKNLIMALVGEVGELAAVVGRSSLPRCTRSFGGIGVTPDRGWGMSFGLSGGCVLPIGRPRRRRSKPISITPIRPRALVRPRSVTQIRSAREVVDLT
jgi:hypothetical protein